jgi:uncharacterized protein
MRIVLDTNVLISAALKQDSTPAAIVRAAQKQAVLLKSAATEQQLFDVAARLYFVPLIGLETQFWLRALMAAAELVSITERITACRDPTDDKFLELAVSGRADLIVTGDADLLVLDPFRGIPIVTPSAYARVQRSNP